MTIRFTVICTNTLTSHNASLTSCYHSWFKIFTFLITVSVEASTLANITPEPASGGCNVNLFFLGALDLTGIVMVGWTIAFAPQTSELICEAECCDFSFFLTFIFAVSSNKLWTVTFTGTCRICTESFHQSVGRFTFGQTL